MVSSLAEISELSLPDTDIWLMENGWLTNQSLETKDCNKLGTDGLGKRHMREHKENHPVWKHTVDAWLFLESHGHISTHHLRYHASLVNKGLCWIYVKGLNELLLT